MGISGSMRTLKTDQFELMCKHAALFIEHNEVQLFSVNVCIGCTISFEKKTQKEMYNRATKPTKCESSTVD